MFGYDLWEPGYVSVAQFRVTNQGSLALKYQLAADLYGETAGKNRDGDTFKLSQYIKAAIVPDNATRADILAMEGETLNTSFAMSKGELAAKNDTNSDEKIVTMAIWMPTTVGNEANHDGTNVPEITFGINLIATQDTVETDSFGKDYDAEASYPHLDVAAVLTGNTMVDPNATYYEIPLHTVDITDDGDYAKQGSAVVMKESVADDAESVEIVIKKLKTADSTVPVAPNETAVTMDITATGIKEGNTEPIKITVDIGKNLGTIKLFHKNVEINYASYSNVDGILIFETTSFSPFTVVYDGKVPAFDVNKSPKAEVTDITAQFAGFDWEKAWDDGRQVTGDPGKQALDAVYKFKAPHTSETIDECEYKEWECDYYVLLKSDTLTTLPEGYIALGGHYGDWGWNGFHNPEIDTNTEIPLLGSVTTIAWTYEGVVNLVSEFMCGVGVNTDVVTDQLNGSQFIVMLRLTNPETREYVNVATVTYDFATKTSTLVESTTIMPAN